MRRYNTTNDVWVRDDEAGDVVFYSEAQAEIERLRAEVDRLTDFIRHIAKVNGKIHGDMVSVAKSEVITAHNDAIVAAADTILTSLANIHIEDGTIDAFNHAVQKCRESILSLKK